MDTMMSGAGSTPKVFLVKEKKRPQVPLRLEKHKMTSPTPVITVQPSATPHESMNEVLQDKLASGSVYVQIPTEHEKHSCLYVFFHHLSNWFC
jgi:hypothetical protein